VNTIEYKRNHKYKGHDRAKVIMNREDTVHEAVAVLGGEIAGYIRDAQRHRALRLWSRDCRKMCGACEYCAEHNGALYAVCGAGHALRPIDFPTARQLDIMVQYYKKAGRI